MRAPIIPNDENTRLEILKRYQILDTVSEESFDDIIHLASFICQTPISLVSIVDQDRQWFKARRGLEIDETARETSFCGHAILEDDLMIVSDACKDSRFFDNPLVLGEPNIRFYAGVPLRSPEGQALGTLCVIDRRPRSLSEAQLDALQRLSRQVCSLLEMRRQWVELSEALKTIKLLSGLVPICSYCKDIRNEDQSWVSIEHYITEHSEAMLTHGLCPDCFTSLRADIEQRNK